MSNKVMQLTHKGGRYQTRGWTGAKFVKRQTSKKSRRLIKKAIRENEGEEQKPIIRGWNW